MDTTEKATTKKQKTIKIKLPKDRERKEQTIYVSVNGVAMLIPLGVEVEVPIKYYNAICDREKDIEVVDEFNAEQEAKNNA